MRPQTFFSTYSPHERSVQDVASNAQGTGTEDLRHPDGEYLVFFRIIARNDRRDRVPVTTSPAPPHYLHAVRADALPGLQFTDDGCYRVMDYLVAEDAGGMASNLPLP